MDNTQTINPSINKYPTGKLNEATCQSCGINDVDIVIEDRYLCFDCTIKEQQRTKVMSFKIKGMENN